MPPRRSSRLQARPLAGASAQQPVDADDGADPETQEPTTRPKKRSKRATGKTAAGGTSGEQKPKLRGNRGKLANFTEMPLDILFEILEHMRPVDILHIARTTKALRGILMCRRTAISIWKAAFSNCPDIPECPDDLNEPQYANLMFLKHCHGCLKPNAKAYWRIRARYCSRCAGERAVTFASFGSDGLYIPMQVIPPRSRSEVRRYIAGSSIAAFRETLNALPSEEERQAFKQACQERERRVIQHVIDCEEWVRKQKNERSRELEEIRDRRYSHIVDRLFDMGYEPERDTIESSAFWNLPQVKHSKELTDREWERILPDLVAYITQQKEQRIRYNRPYRLRSAVEIVKTLVEAYNMRQPPDQPTLAVADVCLLPPFKSVILDTPPDIEITAESFGDAMDLLPQLTPAWFEASTDQLVARIAEITSHEATRQSLELATSWFGCAAAVTCQVAPHHGASIITHHHMHFSLQSDVETRSAYAELSFAFGALKHGPWRPESFELVRGVPELVRACGLDPESATAAEMDALDPWVACRGSRCAKPVEHGEGKGDIKVFNWRAAVQHALYTHRYSSAAPTVWNMLDAKQTEHARSAARPQLEAAAIEVHVCMRCRERVPRGLDNMNLWHHTRGIHSDANRLGADSKPEEFGIVHGLPAPPPKNITLPVSLFQC
ncbi:hypothetical protein PLICRDRAFT_95574 [Plicaturopsis crispa FD-325 SS-3]|uniref:F-box domain-containing protein n=1 Tax=Plicaturopsis crispa FD-325 SS-3 TaxID=944288 RepID=A0A0C9SXB6_PLICR|nr:hypothetical protein PLICRDRAFT_95574 [Plicaturopsis crispa FD-325 SS-3]